MEVSLLDPHGGDLGGFFMVGGSEAQCAALPNDEEVRRAFVDAGPTASRTSASCRQ